MPLLLVIFVAQRFAAALGRYRAASSQAGSDVTGALGDMLGRSYLAVRRSEARAYAAMSDEAQFRGHFYKY